jgi:hypothetical protein
MERAMTSLLSWTKLTVFSAVALLGCGSQQLRLTSPDTAAGIGYTCTSASACYPASVATPAEGQEAEAIVLTLPRECDGRIHEIVVREADSSSPQIDVTCARPQSAPPPGGGGIALTQNP